MRIAYALAVAILGMASVANAEIEKFAVPGDKGFSFYWWPKLAPLEGWHQDRQHSYLYGVNALTPEGFTFKNADSVIYARAIFKPRAAEIKSIEDLIENDRKDFRANSPGVSIQEAPSLTTADGNKLRSFTFFPKGEGNWERVSYGEEGEFYLIFTLSSRSQSGFNTAATAYQRLVAGYRQQP